MPENNKAASSLAGTTAPIKVDPVSKGIQRLLRLTSPDRLGDGGPLQLVAAVWLLQKW